jgi:hypothetical protein
MGNGHNISVIYEILSADLLGTRSGTITSEDSTHKLYLVANNLQSGYNRSSIYIRLRKDIRCLQGEDIKEDMDLAVSLVASLKQPFLC